MSELLLSRSVLTGQLVAFLGTLLEPKILVGRGVAPPAGGWDKGQPGIDTFQAYVVVKTGQALPGPASENLGRRTPRAHWRVGYSLLSSGAKESHVDDVADRVREAVVSFGGTVSLRSVDWTIQKVDVQALGPTTRNDSVDPPFWEVTDAVSVWVSRT